MAEFLRSFYSLDTLSNRSASSVAASAARKAVELAMLNLVSESYSILSILAQHSDASGPLARKIPAEAQFVYQAAHEAPVGVESVDEEGLNSLVQELAGRLPYLPDGVDIVGGDAGDFETLGSWVKQLERDRQEAGGLDATTGYDAMRLSAGLSALLKVALDLNKTAEADKLMARIAERIHANLQSEYLALVWPAWGKYLLSGWLREKLGVAEHELREYSDFVRETTRKRLEEGVLRPVDVYKDKSMKEMLEELDRNTVEAEGFKELLEEFYHEDGDDEGNQDGDTEENEGERSSKEGRYSASHTILRKPATPEQIAEAESTVGRPLPDDLKEFYAITNGTRHVSHGPWPHIFDIRLPTVQSLFWEEEDYMTDYTFELLPGASLPTPIDWPGIEGGGIAMYEHNGQGTDYVWYVSKELVAKAKKVLDEAYQIAEEAEKKVLDGLVSDYHGNWEQLRDMKACWYQQSWGDPDSMVICHDFRAFLSLVVLESRVERDKSPLRTPKEEY